MRALLLFSLALSLVACGDDAEPSAGAVPEVQPLERTPEGGVVDQRVEAVTIRGLTPGERWCEIAYEDADGDAATVKGYPGLCNHADRIGERVQLGLTTFEAPEGCADGVDGCVDGRLEVVNVFLPADADLTETTP